MIKLNTKIKQLSIVNENPPNLKGLFGHFKHQIF